jgi:hypothetical protein
MCNNRHYASVDMQADINLIRSKEKIIMLESGTSKLIKIDDIASQPGNELLLAELIRLGHELTESQISLRDQFAIAAMQSLLRDLAPEETRRSIALDAYGTADEMLKARINRPEE